MELLRAVDYQSREELEADVAKRFGRTVELKPDVQIVGKRMQLKRLHLSDLNTVWGISCVISDTPTVLKKQIKRPARGKIQPFGIDGNRVLPK